MVDAPANPDDHAEGVWHRADNLLYTLAQEGWRRGEPIMANALMVNVTFSPKHATTEQAAAVTDLIHAALSGATRTAGIDVDDLAQAIRLVDSENALGAGALAEKLLPHISRLLSLAAPEPDIGPAKVREHACVMAAAVASARRETVGGMPMETMDAVGRYLAGHANATETLAALREDSEGTGYQGAMNPSAAPTVAAVKAPPLEWVPRGEFHEEGRTPFGRYSVWVDGGLHAPWLSGRNHGSPEAAKQAAQEDFDARHAACEDPSHPFWHD